MWIIDKIGRLMSWVSMTNYHRKLETKESRTMAMLSAIKVAQYFLAQMDDESGDTISNLKLQKLLYYAQGVHLALIGKKLFQERIKAWVHGPVVPEEWHHVKKCGDGNIPRPKTLDFGTYTGKQRETMDEVYRVFGQFSAWKLRNMTHAEPPWTNTPKDEEITPTAMLSYFNTIVTDN